VPLKVTEVAPVRFVPVIVTAVPGAPDVGLNVPTVGAGPDTVKFPPPPGVM
jgi:hypothetical protein